MKENILPTNRRKWKRKKRREQYRMDIMKNILKTFGQPSSKWNRKKEKNNKKLSKWSQKNCLTEE